MFAQKVNDTKKTKKNPLNVDNAVLINYYLPQIAHFRG